MRFVQALGLARQEFPERVIDLCDPHRVASSLKQSDTCPQQPLSLVNRAVVAPKRLPQCVADVGNVLVVSKLLAQPEAAPKEYDSATGLTAPNLHLAHKMRRNSAPALALAGVLFSASGYAAVDAVRVARPAPPCAT